jgi:hypothetical protein
LGLPDPDPSLFCTDADQKAKKVRKALVSTILSLLFDFLSIKTDVDVRSKSTVISKKTLKKKLIFVGILSATDEKSRIRIRIRQSVVRTRGSGSVPTCHESTTRKQSIVKQMNTQVRE